MDSNDDINIKIKTKNKKKLKEDDKILRKHSIF